MEGCLEAFQDRIGVDDAALFDEFPIVRKVVADELSKDAEEWKRKPCHKKWLAVLNSGKYEEQTCQLLKICEYIFCIPGHNANVERVFSLMNIQWSDERNRMQMDTVESILQCLVNYEMTCDEFHTYISGKKKLLHMARSSVKYD